MSETASSFTELIRAQYKVDLPYFFTGSYEEAKKTAHESIQFFVLCLHCPYNENAEDVFVKVLNNEAVVAQLVDRSVCFGASIEDELGAALADMYRPRAYPCLYIFFNNELAVEIAGSFTCETVLKAWQVCTMEWEILVSQELGAKMDREERRRAIEAEMQHEGELEARDRELLEKFERDKKAKELERSRQREMNKKKEEEKRRQDELAAALEKEQVENVLRLAKEKEAASKRLNAEPGADNKDTLTLRLRFPNGEVQSRRFWLEDCVDQLLYYAKCSEQYTDAGSIIQFVAGYPPKPIEWITETTSFKELEAKRLWNTIINVRITTDNKG